ncbi:MAG: membrane dipeptidase, partial [Oscillospiraceae bacterium]
IVLDVSHLNDKSFYEVCENATKPFVASHSNARSVCHMLRNLKDDQLKIIFDGGGVVGINFYPKFIERYKSKDYLDDIYAHIEHMLSLGGENSSALGSDFDGADMEDKMPNQEYLFRLYEYLLSRNIDEKIINKIYYDNAYSFFKKIL